MTGSKTLRWLAIAGMVFGVVTVASGARALFGTDAARSALGDIVPFVLWFNFLAGFVYVFAGGGILFERAWGRYTAAALAVATGIVFLAFGFYVVTGGEFEPRTVGAMTLRTAFWVVVAVASFRLGSNASGNVRP